MYWLRYYFEKRTENQGVSKGAMIIIDPMIRGLRQYYKNPHQIAVFYMIIIDPMIRGLRLIYGGISNTINSRLYDNH